mgnify:CR=1 FL=1
MNHYYFKISTYEQYKMDLLMSEHLQRKMAKLENPKHNDTNSSNEAKLYKSPKRDNMCPQCGQQFHWCICHLKDK